MKFSSKVLLSKELQESMKIEMCILEKAAKRVCA